MDRIGNFVGWISAHIAPLIDWAMTNWGITAIVLIALLYTAGKQFRIARPRRLS